MKKAIDYINVFQGCGKIDLPKPDGIASRWLFIKAQCGNTTPAAAYPFGKMSLCAYTGAYSSGYGNLLPNSCCEPPSFDAKVQGFSHMHQSGTGGIRAYYNFAVSSPIIGNTLKPLEETMLSENAEPGYYAAELSSGVRFEGTVSQRLAYHRYSFPSEGLLQIDFSNDGLNRNLKGFFSLPETAEINIISPTTVTAHIKTHGIDLYFAAECPSAKEAFLWQSYRQANTDLLVPTELSERFGAAFTVSEGISEMKMAISFTSCSDAIAALKSETDDFDKVRATTKAVWGEYISKIEIKTDDEYLAEIFYSNLYHSLIKPCNGCSESYLYDVSESDGEFYFDFASLWDQYKTALPLIFTLYPEEARGISSTLLQITEKNRRSPINVTIAKNNDFTDQARMLVEHTFADYCFRYGNEYAERMLNAAELDLKAHEDFTNSGYCERYTHILDICEALNAMAKIARLIDKTEIAEKFEAFAKNWINAFDESTGLMSNNSSYYEGTNTNYSFRLLHNMDERIALMGKERFIAELDDLFGYTREPIEQPTRPVFDPMILDINSFEGFNNESDMETPYAYLYAGRHDRVCEILRSGMKYMFTKGRGGLPGNNDSGGLSSCYVWNAIGLFPVAGQDLFLIGSPALNGATLRLSSNKLLTINVHNNSETNIYVQRVIFNGQEIQGYKISVRDIMGGGNLDIFMDNSPCLS